MNVRQMITEEELKNVWMGPCASAAVLPPFQTTY